MLSARPATSFDLWFGKGLKCGCCCELEECTSKLMVTTHRTVIEQRINVRYCPWIQCLHQAPEIHITFLAHSMASAYVIQKNGTPSGCVGLRQDLTIKLLQ